jgi:class 3 adenylate cyclase
MLRNLFVDFDRKCKDFNVYKLYTIGDCYVAIGMIDFQKRNPSREAKNILDLAFAMVEIIERVREAINFENLDMRIGIHTVYI